MDTHWHCLKCSQKMNYNDLLKNIFEYHRFDLSSLLFVPVNSVQKLVKRFADLIQRNLFCKANERLFTDSH